MSNELKLSIQWHIINLCNNNCSYCTYRKIRKTKKPTITSKKDLITALNHIYEMDRPEYEFRFMGSGGEPTLHPHLYELITHIEDKFSGKLSKNGIWIMSNGIKDLKYFKKIKSPNITYHISVHSEHTENSHVVDLVTNLSTDSNVHINVMYFPELRDKCRDLIEKLIKLHSEYNFTSRIVYVRAEPNFTEVLPSYTQDDLDYVKRKNLELVSLNHDDNLYWEIDEFCEGTFCVQGANVLRINEWGNYSGSSCMLAKYSDETLFKKRLKEKLSDMISVGQCSQKRCASDVHMSRGTKYTSLEKANAFIEDLKTKINDK